MVSLADESCEIVGFECRETGETVAIRTATAKARYECVSLVHPKLACGIILFVQMSFQHLKYEG